MKKLFAWILTLTWGGIMTAIGLVAALILMLCGHKPKLYKGVPMFEVGHGWGGVTLGCVIIVCKDNYKSLKDHEFGHVIQNLLFGPFAIFLVDIPSMARYWYREYLVRSGKKKDYQLPDYDAIWFEGQATKWGTKYEGLDFRKF